MLHLPSPLQGTHQTTPSEPTVILIIHSASYAKLRRTFTYRLNVAGDMDAFLSRLMDENTVPDDLTDEDDYLFTGEGTYPAFPTAFSITSYNINTLFFA